jgi:NAD(P)-dependent dehydrogenase (short-subunit alcohol dehydrogenase family)
MPNASKKKDQKKPLRPAQKQRRQPGREKPMRPKPRAEDPSQPGSGKLRGKVALITGGDSGIGRAVAIAFAKEGADVAIAYLDEHDDARETEQLVAKHGRSCLLLDGDVGNPEFCAQAVEATLGEFGRLDVLVNNAAEQHPAELEELTDEQLERTFRTNVFSHFYLTRAALPHLRKGACIVNTTSVTAYRGSPELLDYSATKGAIVAFTRSLSQALAARSIRVNAVAPGPVWTPLIPASFSAEKVASFGSDVPMGRAGEPEEIAPSFVFLASDDASYMTGQVLHPNGGEIING